MKRAGIRDFDPLAARLTINTWITGEAAKTRDAVTSAIEEHRYNEAASALYSFVLACPFVTGIWS